MAGLKGLKKGDRVDLEIQAESFISGAKERIDALSITPTTDKVVETKERNRVFERYTFSLNPNVSATIDTISMLPRHFKVNRSEVVRVAIEYLNTLPEAQLIEILQKAKQ
ncbi:MAG TPA: hypothetical protein PLY05_08460 [Agitococcus sp.]|nr:hypothetical protein [Agitococcus sp.]HNC03370.1 hypothetical protein [Agitococcus sp.]